MPVSIQRFLQGERTLPLPFEIKLAGQRFQCVEALRILPARRLVLRAQSESGKNCIIKLFAKAHKGQREYNRECAGYQSSQAAGIKVADLLVATNDESAYCAIVYDYIEQAQSFQLDVNDDSLSDAILQLMAEMHDKGIYQDDIHLDNVLVKQGQLYLIDLASVKAGKLGQGLDKGKSLDNLALLFAQFTVAERNTLMAKLGVYFQSRGWLYDADEQHAFTKRLQKTWNKRLSDYLSKCFRNCSMTVFHQDFHWQYAFKRNFWESWRPHDISEVEALFADAVLLKAGNTATVIRAELGGQQVVIKRYNIKHAWHGLRRCLRKSRAAQSWRNGNMLNVIGIATPEPLGFIEKRWGWLRRTAYFISAYEAAEELLDVYQHRQPTGQEAQQIQTIFALLRQCNIGHGDMKAQNLLVDQQGKVSLIDLDAMKRFTSSKRSERASRIDKQRFLRNWQNEKLKTFFAKLIE